MKGQVNEMEDGKKKIWICLLVIVLAAVAAGGFYYLSAPDGTESEGVLNRVRYSGCGPEGVGGEV